MKFLLITLILSIITLNFPRLGVSAKLEVE